MSSQDPVTKGPAVDLLLIAYSSSEDDPNNDSRFSGQDQRRVEVKLAPRVPAEIAGNMRKMTEWSRGKVNEIVLDIKHSQRWHCEFCDKLARESKTNVASWLHLTPPKLIVYVHLVCDTMRGPCAAQLEMIEAQMAAMTGGPKQSAQPAHVNTSDMVFPAAASCTKCKREETISRNMSRCARCKLSRYCGVECQRQDWPRHKDVCKIIRNVEWVWP